MHLFIHMVTHWLVTFSFSYIDHEHLSPTNLYEQIAGPDFMIARCYLRKLKDLFLERFMTEITQFIALNQGPEKFSILPIFSIRSSFGVFILNILTLH